MNNMKGNWKLAFRVLAALAVIAGIIVYFAFDKGFGILLVALGFFPDLCDSVKGYIKTKEKHKLVSICLDSVIIVCMLVVAVLTFMGV